MMEKNKTKQTTSSFFFSWVALILFRSGPSLCSYNLCNASAAVTEDTAIKQSNLEHLKHCGFQLG